MKVILFDFSRPSRNGTIYPAHAVEQAIAKAHWAVPVKWDDSRETTESNLIGAATGLFVEGKTLTADISLYNNSNSLLLKQLIENGNNISYSIGGTATTTKDSEGHNIIGNDFQLQYISINIEQQTPQIENE